MFAKAITFYDGRSYYLLYWADRMYVRANNFGDASC